MVLLLQGGRRPGLRDVETLPSYEPKGADQEELTPEPSMVQPALL